MEKSIRSSIWLCLCISLAMASLSNAEATKKITVENKCSFTVWPGIASYDKIAHPEPAGFQPVLNSGASFSTQFEEEWAGIIWGRFGCSFNSSEKGSCLSGDCGGFFRCEKASWLQKSSTPISEVEIGEKGRNAVNLERGYNLPLSIKSSCGSQGCSARVADVCPNELQIKMKNEVVACNATCNSYVQQCTPSSFDSAFRKSCPNVIPFQTSYLKCSPQTTYVITFCP